MEESARRPLAVTQGDTEGIGPELLLRAAADGRLRESDRVFASRAVLDSFARRLPQTWAREGRAAIEPLLEPGVSASQVEALERAVDLVLSEPGRGLVTAPIDKAACAALGFRFPGHTEYLAHRAGVAQVCMAMIGPRLRVALATVHVPLRAVPTLLSRDRVLGPTRLLGSFLRRELGLERPRVGVLGLNPHAGERGLLGDEEARIIEPAIAQLVAESGDGLEVSGPLPADTAFALHAQGRLDGVVAMYHDQGLCPFKLLHFADGVNATLGLPFVRTSPDHGTARDIAGRGVADAGSMATAIRLAIDWAQRRIAILSSTGRERRSEER
jgi:4-hydroxythreonine-4-phosphate dehydrogenase